MRIAAFIFLSIAAGNLVAAKFGFMNMNVAQTLCFIFTILGTISLIASLVVGKKIYK